ncbi:MAG TPA: amidase [Rubrivivax sp.]|nr:amidase [Rubrivivax sp.]
MTRHDRPTPDAPDAVVARIERLQPALNAFVSVGLRPGTPGGHGLEDMTIAIKDCVDVAGDCAGVGTAVLAGRRAAATASAVQRLLDAGATLVGRTQMVELAFGGWGLNAVLGTPRNPWDGRVARLPGGSSSGSAVAVAAGLARAALGSDTAGSIRMPAALCGITGLKPSAGRVPVDGVYPLAPSFDSLGPMARSASDCARLFEVMAAAPLARAESIAGWRVARLAAASYPVVVDPAVEQALDAAAQGFARLGAQVAESAAPFSIASLTRDAGTLISAEAWQAHHALFEGDAAGGFGTELRRRMAQARDLDPAAVAAARAARAGAAQRFERWMGECDALLLPTVPRTAPALAEVDESTPPLGQFTRWVNFVGGCAISLPAGFDAQGLPLAIQLVARAGAEARLLALACAWQRATDWHRREPDLRWAG